MQTGATIMQTQAPVLYKFITPNYSMHFHNPLLMVKGFLSCEIKQAISIRAEIR